MDRGPRVQMIDKVEGLIPIINTRSISFLLDTRGEINLRSQMLSRQYLVSVQNLSLCLNRRVAGL